MKKIKIINYVSDFICGNIVTLDDYSGFLSKYYECTHMFAIGTPKISADAIKNIDYKKHYANTISILFKRLKNRKFSTFSYDNININDTILTTFWQLIVDGNSLDFSRIKAKTLIIIDSLDVYTEYLRGTIRSILDNISNNYTYIYILCNPFNRKILENVKFLPKNIQILQYFVKIPSSSNVYTGHVNDVVITKSKMLYNKYSKQQQCYYYDTHNKFVDMCEYNHYAYCRHYMLENGIYIENIGRILFEFLLNNKQVDYYPINKTIDDGMHYYLEQIGIDSNKTYIDAQVDKNIVESKFGFSENDLLMNIINIT